MSADAGASLRHPLLAAVPRDYWRSDAACEAAQEEIARSVDEMLALLAASLDPQRQWSPRFWRMTAGTVLWAVLSAVFDRQAEPTSAQVEQPDAGFDPSFVFFSARDCVLALEQKPALRAWLDALNDAGDAPAACARMQSHIAALQVDREGPRRRTPQRARRARWLRRLQFWQGPADVGHYAAPFSHRDAMQLALQSRGRIRRLACPEASARLIYDGARRAQLAQQWLVQAGRPLLRQSVAAIAALLPTAVLEQRDELAQWADAQPQPMLLVSALGFERSPYYAALADRLARRGGRVIGLQHGGFYGQTEPTFYERIENEVSDLYCTWGYQQQPSQRPMPSPRLTHLRAAPRRGAFARRLLWAYSSNATGLPALERLPHPRREGEMHAVLAAAVAQVQRQTPFTLTMRPYPRMGRLLFDAAWQHEFPALQVEAPAGRSLLQHAAGHDLTVFNFPGATGFLEFLHVDQPALIFCPPAFCPVRPAAAPAFTQLAEAGLYARSEDEFAAAIAAWSREGEDWWQAPQRRAARAAFVAHFARASDALIGEWSAFLLQCLAQTGPGAEPLPPL